MARIKTITLGCRFNYYESEVAKSIIEKYEPKVDVVVINTCAVTHEAERQSKQAVRKAIRENPEAKVIVTGCATVTACKYFDELKGITIINNAEKGDYAAYRDIVPNSKAIDCGNETVTDGSDELFANRVRAFLPIQNGCDNFCTYCIVPYTRGRSQSLPLDIIIQRVNHFISIGFREIVISGIDVTSYRCDSLTLADVIKEILHKTSLERLRISSLDPAGIDKALIDIIINESRIMPHFHLSIQSGDNDVLKAMRRRHTREDVIELCNDILNKRPEVVFGSDFIAGFPSETEAMFQNTLKLIDEAHLSLMHVFPFSPRTGTIAAQMIQLPKKIIFERAGILREKSQQAKANLLKTLVGSVLEGIVEKTENELSFGKTNSSVPFITRGIISPKTVINGTAINSSNEHLELSVI